MTALLVRYSPVNRFVTALVLSALTIYVGLWFAGPNITEPPRNNHVKASSSITTTSPQNDLAIAKLNNATPVQAQTHNRLHPKHISDSEHTKNEGDIPEALNQYIESQRIPAADIPLIIHGNGNTTAYTGNQWSTVVMAVIDDDGTHRTVERKVLPIGTLKVTPMEIQQ